MKQKKKKIAVILMTYGSPKTIADVPAYLKNVYGGKDPSEENYKEFQRRYELIGGSPLIKITKQQANALQKELNKKTGKMIFRVGAAMRFSHPFIEEVVGKIAKDADVLVGIIMSPQYSPIIMSGYSDELKAASEKLQRKDLVVTMATDWHKEPYFLEALAQRVVQVLKAFPKNAQVPVLFSAHSMPKRVIDKEPGYIADLKETADEVAKRAGLSQKQWLFCYQSAGHTPEEWLKPDFADIMPDLAKKGQKYVLIAPVQFLADHLEILYDVAIAAKEQADRHGIQFARTQPLNTSALFIKSLARTVHETLPK